MLATLNLQYFHAVITVRRTAALYFYYSVLITPKVPATLLCGPAVKNSWLGRPSLAAPPPPPHVIPQSWSIRIGLPLVWVTVPTNAPVSGLKPLMVPLFVLFETKSVLLSLPKLFGAMASPQGW